MRTPNTSFRSYFIGFNFRGDGSLATASLVNLNTRNRVCTMAKRTFLNCIFRAILIVALPCQITHNLCVQIRLLLGGWWLWLSWYSGCFQYQRYAARIQSTANFTYCQLYWNDESKEKICSRPNYSLFKISSFCRIYWIRVTGLLRSGKQVSFLVSFSFIFVFTNKHYNSHNKLIWIFLCPSSIQPRIQTHYLRNTSLIP